MRYMIGLLEKEILRYLLAKGSQATAHEISTSISQNYNTTVSRLEKLQLLGFVKQNKRGRHTLWEVIKE
jgi:predicted transcriptional regulator